MDYLVSGLVWLTEFITSQLNSNRTEPVPAPQLLPVLSAGLLRGCRCWLYPPDCGEPKPHVVHCCFPPQHAKLSCPWPPCPHTILTVQLETPSSCYCGLEQWRKGLKWRCANQETMPNKIPVGQVDAKGWAAGFPLESLPCLKQDVQAVKPSSIRKWWVSMDPL